MGTGVLVGIRVVAVAAALALVSAACNGDDPSGEAVTATSTAAGPAPQPISAGEGLPEPVAETRAAILAGAETGDYDALAPLVVAESFLSDAGFGADPVAGWREQGSAPLDAMTRLLALPHTVRETNEGTLYQWPRFTAGSDPAEMSEAEREALAALLGEGGLERSFQAETGYTAPRLGILADDTWWFLVLDPAP